MFWASIVATLFILIDGLVKQIGGKSLFGDFHWVALRVLDLLLCISVFFYSRKLENLLDMKEKIFQEQGGYAKGRLTSPFIQMRRK